MNVYDEYQMHGMEIVFGWDLQGPTTRSLHRKRIQHLEYVKNTPLVREFGYIRYGNKYNNGGLTPYIKRRNVRVASVMLLPNNAGPGIGGLF